MLIKKQSGFTLIEIAVVLVIIGLFMGSFIGTFASRIDTTRRAETVDEMEVIKQALYGYAVSDAVAHLPCPDCRTAACVSGGIAANDGLEDRNGAVCDVDVADVDVTAGTIPIGNLPWRTLGLGYADAWDNRYSYWASSSVTDSTANLQLDGAMDTATINTRTGTNLTEVSDKAVAIIMSHGKNGFSAVSTQGGIQANPPAANIDELGNLDDDLNFVSRPKTDEGVAAAIGAFDDLFVWISEYELKARMIEAGKLPVPP